MQKMRTAVYYFTGTGNSFVVARDIAEKIDGGLVPIAAVVEDDFIRTDAETIVIVFPVYYADAPIIVRRFIEKLDAIDDKYIVAVCTYGGGTGESLHTIKHLVSSRGGTVWSWFGVSMVQNAFHKPWEQYDKLYSKWLKKRDAICNRIMTHKKGGLVSDFFLYLLTFPIHLIVRPLTKKGLMKISHASPELTVEEHMVLLGKAYKVNENCTGCGMCAKVCPVSNITMMDKKPVWDKRCENCLACYHWCPQQAIYDGLSPNDYRYTCPHVTAGDIIKQKKVTHSGPDGL